MTRLLLVGLLLSACASDGDDREGGGGPAGTTPDAAGGNPSPDAASTPTPDAPVTPPSDGGPAFPDAIPLPVCDGLDQDTCDATAGCEPGCVSLCDCTCDGPPGFEGCEGCDACPKSCFTYVECVDATRCGEKWCNPATQICVVHSAFVLTYDCEPVPAGCEADRSCGCAAASLCEDPYSLCIDSAPNTIDCECPVCAF